MFDAAGWLSFRLLGCGLASIAWVDPAIERMFQDGATLLPRFAALHTMSERLGHLEVSLTVILFAAFAWPSSTRADDGSTHDEAGEPDERDRIGTASMRESAR